MDYVSSREQNITRSVMTTFKPPTEHHAERDDYFSSRRQNITRSVMTTFKPRTEHHAERDDYFQAADRTSRGA